MLCVCLAGAYPRGMAVSCRMLNLDIRDLPILPKDGVRKVGKIIFVALTVVLGGCVRQISGVQILDSSSLRERLDGICPETVVCKVSGSPLCTPWSSPPHPGFCRIAAIFLTGGALD